MARSILRLVTLDRRLQDSIVLNLGIGGMLELIYGKLTLTCRQIFKFNYP